MADPQEKNDDLAVMESRDGSATVDLPNDMIDDGAEGGQEGSQQAKNDADNGHDEDADQPGDDEGLRTAKRNRRRAKKDLIRKTNQEKDVRLQQLQRENEAMRRDIEQLKRNTKAEQLTRKIGRAHV